MPFLVLNGNVITGDGGGDFGGNPPANHVLVNQSTRELYKSLSAQAREDGRGESVVEWNSQTLQPELPADNRPLVQITSNVSTLQVGGNITFTFTLPNNTGYNGKDVLALFYGRFIKLDFTNGVASKTVSPPDNGIFVLTSNYQYRVETPLQITVYD